MSIRGFVKVISADLKGGLGDDYEACVTGSMDLDGELTDFWYGRLRDTLVSKSERRITIEIDFTREQEFDRLNSSMEAQFIGTVQLLGGKGEEDTGTKVHAYARITMGMWLFPALLSLKVKDESVLISIFADWITEPTKAQKVDHVVALVRRVEFKF